MLLKMDTDNVGYLCNVKYLCNEHMQTYLLHVVECMTNQPMGKTGFCAFFSDLTHSSLNMC